MVHYNSTLSAGGELVVDSTSLVYLQSNNVDLIPASSASSTAPSQAAATATATTTTMMGGGGAKHHSGPAISLIAVNSQGPAIVGQQQQQQQQPQKPQFQCDQCNMCFGSKSAHTSHMKSHAKYATQQLMQMQQQQHQQSPHSTSPPIAHSDLEATAAGLNLTQASDQAAAGVAATMATNSDPYQCDVCKKTFAVPARLVSRAGNDGVTDHCRHSF